MYWASPGSQTWNIQKEYDYMQLHIIYMAPTFALWNTYKQMDVNNARNPKRGLQRNIPALLSKGKLKWISYFRRTNGVTVRLCIILPTTSFQAVGSVHNCLNITPALRNSEGWSACLNPLFEMFATVQTTVVFVKQPDFYNTIIPSTSLDVSPACHCHPRHHCC